MKITIEQKILSGNLGDGWADQNEAANGLAKYTANRFREYLEKYYGDYSVEINVSAVRNTSGCGGDVRVSVEPDDEKSADNAFDLLQNLETELLDVSDRAWTDFCGGDGKEFFAD
jgi:hypothetical protein